MVYYFHVKWYAGLGKIVCFPIICFFRSRLFENYWKKKEVADVNKYMKEGLKQAQISESWMRAYLGGALTMPLFAIETITHTLLKKNGIVNSINDATIIYIGYSVAIAIAFWSLQNYLLGKNDEYRKYFKEFDKMFKNNPRNKWLYGPLCFLIVVALYSTFVFGFIISDFIKNG